MKRIVILLVLMAVSCSAKPTAPVKAVFEFPGVPVSCRQIVIVFGSATDFHAHLELWEIRDGDWAKHSEMPATVGKNGLATADVKKEGDGKTPTGIYRVERAFGYAEKLETGLTYRKAGPTDLWVDDAASPDYNLWVTAPTEAKSFEEMKRKDDLYELGAVIEYNTNPVVPGKGSAIFFHVWGGPDSPTAGYMAIEKSKLAEVLKWLDKSKSPHFDIRITP